MTIFTLFLWLNEYENTLEYFIKNRSGFIIFLLVIFFQNEMKAEQDGIYFGSIPDESGLSQKTISCIFQDKKGFLWFGTRDGLNRFDGYNFEVFRNDESDSTTISNNNVSGITGDSNGDIWIATENGLNCYRYSTNCFTRYYKGSGNKNISNNKVASLFFDNKGRLWIGTEQGIDLYSAEKQTFEKTTLDGNLFNNRIICIFCDSYGNIWIGTLLGGLMKYNPEGGSYQIYRNVNSESVLSGNPVRTIYEDSRRNLWIGTRTGLRQYDARTNSFLTFGKDIFKGKKLSNDGIRCIVEDTEKNLLIGTNEGLNILNPETGELRIFNSSRKGQGNLNHFYIYSILVDRAGTVWLGSYMGGINFYNRFNQQFRYINPGVIGQRVYGGVGPLAEKDNKLWIGTGGGGLYCLDMLSNTVSHYQLNDTSFASNVIKSLFIRNDSIFIGDEEGELLIFDIPNKRVVRSVQVSSNPILNIYQAGGRKLFLCVRDSTGVRLFDPETMKIKPLTHKVEGDSRDMLFPYPNCIEKENDSILWIGTRYVGLYRYNRNQNTAVRYSNVADKANSLINNHISVITQGVQNNLWIGTNGGGLYFFDKTTGEFQKYDEKDGLSNRIVLGILNDNSDQLWISTITGISRFDPITASFKTYVFGNGFPLQEPADYSASRLSDGTLCFGGNNGLVIFNPEKITENKYIPPIVITEFRTSGSKKDNSYLQKKFLPDAYEMRLKYNQSSFVISYTALNYIFPEKNQYAYQLEGFDEDWNYVDKQRIASYTNLHTGNYKFKLKASNNDGLWSDDFVSFNIKILPPPWLTWYAYIFYFLIFAGLSFLMILFIRLENIVKIKQLEKENLEKAHQLRIRMFTNFSHELRTPLTLIIGPLKDLLSRSDINEPIRETLTLIQQNANRLLLIVNQLMDFRKQESGKMQLKAAESNFSAFMREISLVFNDLSKKQKIKYSFSVFSEDITLWFDRLLLEKVFFNLLSNAFKNTPEGGEISIVIDTKVAGSTDYSSLKSNRAAAEFIIITISDTGKGISKENQEKIFDPFFQVSNEHQSVSVGTGIGLSLSKGIVELHSGVIKVESTPDKGSHFMVFLPKGKEHLKENEIISRYNEMEFQSPDYVRKETNNGLIEHKPDLHTVLLVEDNPEVSSYIKNHLSNLYNIISADNGNDGFIKATEEMPDLIISDVMMPGMDGLELCNNLKNNINTCHIPVILLTALTDFEQIKHGFEVGSDDYIIKPFDPSVLKIKINSLICNRERLRKAFSNKFLFEKETVGISTHDQEFLERTFSILDKYIADQSFDLDVFCTELGMSRANLYRKIKALTDFAPNELINNYRLKTALRLLQENNQSISEISYRVGFSSPAYFSNCFKKSYGVSPSEYTSKLKSNIK
jgi:signal transduction histidine kinase/ligand-binding sensor domain-containing protein/CheY-like chemotaxis protein